MPSSWAEAPSIRSSLAVCQTKGKGCPESPLADRVVLASGGAWWSQYGRCNEAAPWPRLRARVPPQARSRPRAEDPFTSGIAASSFAKLSRETSELYPPRVQLLFLPGVFSNQPLMHRR